MEGGGVYRLMQKSISELSINLGLTHTSPTIASSNLLVGVHGREPLRAN